MGDGRSIPRRSMIPRLPPDIELSVLVMQHKTKPYERNQELEEDIRRAIQERKGSIDIIVAPEYSFCTGIDIGRIREFMDTELSNEEFNKEGDLVKEAEHTTLIAGMAYKDGRFYIANQTWIIPPHNIFIHNKDKFSKTDQERANKQRLVLIKGDRAPNPPPRIKDPSQRVEYMISMSQRNLKKVSKAYSNLDMLLTLGDQVEFEGPMVERRALKNGGYWVVCNRVNESFVALNNQGILEKLPPNFRDPAFKLYKLGFHYNKMGDFL